MMNLVKKLFSKDGIRLLLHKLSRVFLILRTEGWTGFRSRIRLSWLEFSQLPEKSSRLSPAQKFFGNRGIPADSYASHYEDDLDFSDRKTDIKALAFYLPQFHTFPENDRWWGKGFTEWTNTRKAQPKYPSHYQPRIPHDDVGYYDLSDYRVLQQQADMVNRHGLYGLCIYHYWFSGKRLMEKPADLLLAHPEIKLRFCLCWANEDWTRAWDGLSKEILIAQQHENDDLDFIRDLKKYLMDPRYIRVNGEPLVLIYRPGSLPDAEKTFRLWRQWALKNGIGPIRILAVRGCTTNADSVWVKGADGEVEFPPAFCTVPPVLKNTADGGQIFHYPGYVNELISGRGCVEQYPHPVYRGAMLGWDCTPRRKAYHSWYGFSPEWYYRWLRYNIEYTRKYHDPEERFIFINAWNEWAEGTYLEPDRLFGYTNLNTTSKAIFDLPLENRISKAEDMEYVTNCKYFDRRWYLKTFSDVASAGMDPLEHFISTGWKEGRDASPFFPSALYLLFNPGARQNDHSLISELKLMGRDSDYLEELVRRFDLLTSKTMEKLKVEKIVPPVPAAAPSNRRIAVHLHCFYADMLPGICQHLKSIPCPFDLLISIPQGTQTPEAVKRILKMVQKKLPQLGELDVREVPNRGRDLAPMLCTFGKKLMRYDYVCHVHTKKSLHTPSHAHWAEFIYEHLFGGRGWMQRLLALLEKDAGFIYPPDYLMMREEPSGWGSNFSQAQEVLDRARVNVNLRRDFPVIEFPQGSMFWAKSDYLRPLFELDWKYEDFPAEPLGTDGSIAHGIERLFLVWGMDRPEKVCQVFKEEERALIYGKRYCFQKFWPDDE